MTVTYERNGPPKEEAAPKGRPNISAVTTPPNTNNQQSTAHQGQISWADIAHRGQVLLSETRKRECRRPPAFAGSAFWYREGWQRSLRWTLEVHGDGMTDATRAAIEAVLHRAEVA